MGETNLPWAQRPFRMSHMFTMGYGIIHDFNVPVGIHTWRVWNEGAVIAWECDDRRSWALTGTLYTVCETHAHQ